MKISGRIGEKWIKGGMNRGGSCHPLTDSDDSYFFSHQGPVTGKAAKKDIIFGFVQFRHIHFQFGGFSATHHC